MLISRMHQVVLKSVRGRCNLYFHFFIVWSLVRKRERHTNAAMAFVTSIENRRCGTFYPHLRCSSKIRVMACFLKLVVDRLVIPAGNQGIGLCDG